MNINKNLHYTKPSNRGVIIANQLSELTEFSDRCEQQNAIQNWITRRNFVRTDNNCRDDDQGFWKGGSLIVVDYRDGYLCNRAHGSGADMYPNKRTLLCTAPVRRYLNQVDKVAPYRRDLSSSQSYRGHPLRYAACMSSVTGGMAL